MTSPTLDFSSRISLVSFTSKAGLVCSLCATNSFVDVVCSFYSTAFECIWKYSQLLVRRGYFRAEQSRSEPTSFSLVLLKHGKTFSEPRKPKPFGYWLDRVYTTKYLFFPYIYWKCIFSLTAQVSVNYVYKRIHACLCFCIFHCTNTTWMRSKTIEHRWKHV